MGQPWDPGHHTADIRAGATTSQKAQHVRIPDWLFRKAEETSHLFVVFALSQSLDCVSPLVIINLAQEQANYSRGSMSWLPTCRSKAERDCLCLLQLVHSMPGRLRKTVIIVLCPLSCSPPPLQRYLPSKYPPAAHLTRFSPPSSRSLFQPELPLLPSCPASQTIGNHCL